MCNNRVPNSPRSGYLKMREVIQIGDTLKAAVFHFLTRDYAQEKTFCRTVVSPYSSSGIAVLVEFAVPFASIHMHAW